MGDGSVPVGVGCDPNAPRWQEPADQVVNLPAEVFSGEVSVPDSSSDTGSAIEIPTVEVVGQDGGAKSSTTEDSENNEGSNPGNDDNSSAGGSTESPIVAQIL